MRAMKAEDSQIDQYFLGRPRNDRFTASRLDHYGHQRPRQRESQMSATT